MNVGGQLFACELELVQVSIQFACGIDQEELKRIARLLAVVGNRDELLQAFFEAGINQADGLLGPALFWRNCAAMRSDDFGDDLDW